MSRDDLVPMHEAARRLGISRVTLRRRLAELGVPCYRSARDTRLRLVRASDIDRMFRPVLEARTRKEGGR